ncbi:sarcosine oxidase subunit gamma [Actinoplanes lobatus]|uniref:Sarcosine oxidase subunit gamma n=1 Tax=Actinoplanes lobatus TaxID=113568 RepID=A0A7W7MHG4_9ACTN|nr:sarcosine oxidase subunit gamma family protein [Actinoplanes lobatus]MBB4750482.1 sarcosine oxidase subunit gamma [Actinoplanes lobatus]GGN90164.1 sarcosine oxidase subunit gamma [Actinoplanes lobatus]GIE43841.1 sarcosine oxidase subunit gamma [Actinoplanes lobatus]
MAERNSPLGGAADRLAAVAVATGGAVTVAEVPFLTQLNVRALPSKDVNALQLGPDEWLIVGEPLETPGSSVVDVSAQRTTVAVGGSRVLDLLAMGCAIDLHPRVFRVGDCAQTTVAHAPVIIWRRETEFWILVRASFAAHLADWLVDAAQEFTAGD